MRIVHAMVIIALGIASACGGRTGNVADTPGAQAAAPITLPEYDAIEKRIGARFSAVRMRLAAGEPNSVAAEVQELAVSFGESEQFWAQRKQAEAMGWASRGRALAAEAAGAAVAGDAAAVRRAVASMERTCTQCHAAHRQADPAGGYRVKGAAVAR